MAIYKNESNNTWYVMARYQDWTGERKQKCKRGFATKREAAQWEQQFILQKKASMDMELESFCKLYEEDVRPRLKKSTWFTKENIIKSKILPYLGKRKVSEITAKDVLDWHNELRKLTSRRGKPLSPTYLKTIHGQLSTIFNHAIKFYDLSTNPARKAGTIGSEESKEMLFWTKAEYKQFSEEMMDKPLSYYAFQLLYWCGIRSGELLALTPADFNFQKRTLRINKSYQRLKGEDVISTPKTKNSIRTVTMPKFLCDEMQDCLKLYYSLQPDDRIFPVTKYYLNHEMERGCKASGVKKIRVHDLRHSHVSLLINMGYTALAIGKRVGHSAEKITYRYAHLFPSVQQDMADQLDAENMNKESMIGKEDLRMSAKCLDKQGRWRNKTVAFRVSPEEDELLETAVRLSGLTKQDYITRRLQEKEVVVTGNPRVYKALKNELAKVLNELKRLKRVIMCRRIYWK